MPESYTGNEGTTAAANGMATMDGNEDRRNGWLAINKTRDYIVAKVNAAITSAVASAKTYTDSKFNSISLTWDAITGKPSTFPPSSHTHSAISDPGSGAYFRWTGTQWLANALVGIGAALEVASTATIGGNLTLNTASPVTSGYATMYRNGDGRVGISPSARRFKKDIRPHTYSVEDLESIRVVDYRLKADIYGSADAPIDVGVIAEELIDAGLSEFVVFDGEGDPLSVHYERLALVAIGAVQELSQRVKALEAR